MEEIGLAVGRLFGDLHLLRWLVIGIVVILFHEQIPAVVTFVGKKLYDLAVWLWNKKGSVAPPSPVSPDVPAVSAPVAGDVEAPLNNVIQLSIYAVRNGSKQILGKATELLNELQDQAQKGSK